MLPISMKDIYIENGIDKVMKSLSWFDEKNFDNNAGVSPRIWTKLSINFNKDCDKDGQSRNAQVFEKVQTQAAAEKFKLMDKITQTQKFSTIFLISLVASLFVLFLSTPLTPLFFVVFVSLVLWMIIAHIMLFFKLKEL
jgi:ABC-type bacteriocin/lantibiotic exporter with double-glycine peptidase domain